MSNLKQGELLRVDATGIKVAMAPRPLLAFKTQLCGERCVVFAESRARAKLTAYQAARDAGFYGANFIEVRTQRAPELDDATVYGMKPERGHCYNVDVIEVSPKQSQLIKP